VPNPVILDDKGEQKLFGANKLWEVMRQVRMARKNLRIVQSKQKSYADHRRTKLSFEVGDYMYLKVSLMRCLWSFKWRGKLAPRFIGPFEIMEEREEEMKAEFPNFFSDPSESRGRDSLRGVGLSHHKISNFGLWLQFSKI
jgi:hypothetical protein